MSSSAPRSTSSQRYASLPEELKPNEGQWAAYEARGSVVILAGPGSGKTKTLTAKMARVLAEDVRRPQGVACITYSNECARELRRRLQLLGIEDEPNVFVGTLHSFCLQAVVQPYAKLAGVSISHPIRVPTQAERQQHLSKALGETISLDENPTVWAPRIKTHRETVRDSDSLEAIDDDNDIARLLAAVQRSMMASGHLDFDDIIYWGRRLIESHAWVRRAVAARYPVIFVDEYQDLGMPLHRIVVSLVKQAKCRLIAVGDPDQSIYGFNGAKPELLGGLAEELDIPSISLRTNYRSGTKIVKAAEIALGGEARGYEANTSHSGGILFHHCPDHGLDGQSWKICRELLPAAMKRSGQLLGNIAVLYRTKFQGDAIAQQVRQANIRAVRSDLNAAYHATPLTEWMEECAKWCSDGWKSGDVRLGGLMKTWLRMNRTTTSSSQRRELRLQLVRFLMKNRDGDKRLKDWIAAFQEGCITEAIKREKQLQDSASVLDKLCDLAGDGGEFADFTVKRFAGQGGSPDHLHLMTLHNAKGLEFDIVYMLGMDEGILPSDYHDNTEARLREARRLFFVGLTRARHEVHLLYSGYTENQYGKRFAKGPSRFVVELQSKMS